MGQGCLRLLTAPKEASGNVRGRAAVSCFQCLYNAGMRRKHVREWRKG